MLKILIIIQLYVEYSVLFCHYVWNDNWLHFY